MRSPALRKAENLEPRLHCLISLERKFSATISRPSNLTNRRLASDWLRCNITPEVTRSINIRYIAFFHSSGRLLCSVLAVSYICNAMLVETKVCYQFTGQWSLYVPHSGNYMYRTVVTVCNAQWSLYVMPGGHYMYRSVVTICTAQWSLYTPPSGHYM